MPKNDLTVAGDHDTVAERIRRFYASFPGGRIITELVSRSDGVITFRASVFRDGRDDRPATTGWAAEREGDVDTVSCLENAETSAIGRALANLGFTDAAARPSRAEMEKTGRVRVREGGAVPVAATMARPARLPPASRRSEPACADAVADLTGLLGEAVRRGLEPARARRLVRRIRECRSSVTSLERVERVLRRSLAESDRDLLADGCNTPASH